MGDKLSILIVSYYFAPQNAIGAVRATKFAKYLSRMGHEVTIICGEGLTSVKDPTLSRDLEELHEVRVVREWNPIRDYQKRKGQHAAKVLERSMETERAFNARQSRGLKWRLKNKLYLALLYLADQSFSMRGSREISRMGQRFDVVLSSYGPLSSHRIGRKVKERGIAKRWIADFRDPVAHPLWTNTGYVNRYINGVKRYADGVCAVSNGVLNSMGMNEKAKAFSNGFDYEDLKGISGKKHKNDTRLCFAYCGQLYQGKQGLNPFFDSLHGLVRDGVCTLQDVKVVYAGPDGSLLYSQAAAAGMEAIVRKAGFVNREQSLALQKEADVLFAASWNHKGEIGILTGKLLEYLMMGKPIVCIMSGDVADSETKQLLAVTGAGFCYEQANQAEDQKELSAYLRELIARKFSGETLAAERNQQAAEQYAYPNIVARFERWIREDILH